MKCNCVMLHVQKRAAWGVRSREKQIHKVSGGGAARSFTTLNRCEPETEGEAEACEFIKIFMTLKR